MRTLGKGLLLILAVLLSLQAQDITKGSIAGSVRDASGAVVPGAAVKLTSPYGDRATTTDALGAYSFLNLLVGSGYVVSVQQPGFSTATTGNLSIGVNRQTTVDIALEVGTATQSVQVTSEASPAIDLSSTTIGANINESLYRNVPIGRNISSVIAMSPGVSDSGGAGAANPSINGASGLENEYIVDGANTTDPGFGGFGTYSRNYGPLGNGINFDFVQEVQVQSGGFESQYGMALGGVVNVLTKSGSNAYHGDVFGYFGPQQFEATRTNGNNLLVNKFDFLEHQGSLDYGADGGGYIIRDKLFWYAGINPLYNHNYKVADPIFANAALGAVDREFRTLDYTAKINYNLGTRHQLEGSVFGDPSNTPTTFNAAMSSTPAPGPIDTTPESKLEYGTRTWTGRYNGTLTNRWLVTANYSNYYNSFTETPLHNGYQIFDNTPGQENPNNSNLVYGGVGSLEATESKVNQFSVSGSNIFTFFGGHTVTYGYQFEDDVYNDLIRYTGANFTFPNVPELKAAAGQAVYGAIFTRTHLDPNDPTSPIVMNLTRSEYSNPVVPTDTRYHSGFIQDAWTFGRITFKPGMRFEQQSLIGNTQGYVFAHNWAPRLGIIVDPFNNRKTKVYASVGRFFEKVPLDIAVRELSIQTQLTGALYKDPGPGAQPNVDPSNYIPGGAVSFQGTAGLTPIAGGTAAQFQDEIVAGVEHQFSNNFTFSGRFVYRDMRRILEDTSGVNVTQALAGVPQQYVIANPSRALDIYQNSVPCTSGPNCNTAIGYTNFANGTDNPLGSDGTVDGFPNPSRIYKSMELIVSKRFATNFQFYGSYVLSKLYGNYPGSFRGDNFQTDPNISSLFDFTNSDGVLTGQDTPGVLPTDRRHQIKMFGNYQWRAFNFGAGWNIASGTPLTKLLDHPAYLNSGEIPDGPRGALGRSDWALPFNAHADYTWKLSEKMRLRFVADLFNLFNQQEVIRVNQNFEINNSPGQKNPDFLLPDLQDFYNSGAYQNPFSARLAIRFEF
ncbi:MAG: carboxypeptidase regulatory-like domain-containing protein [Acidobacteriia bacterium]|nr:carboxypeptidase regulatory-like domain-containing protein [Terriglobia bacterium]